MLNELTTGAMNPTTRIDTTGVREMSVRPRYFDLIQTLAKSIEVRVAYPANTVLVAGSLIRFSCNSRECLTRIRRVTRYTSFTDLLDREGAETVDPTATRAEILEALSGFYPPQKEALGALAIEIELVDGAAFEADGDILGSWTGVTPSVPASRS